MFAMQPRLATTFVPRDHQSLAVVTSGLGENWVVIGIYLHRFPFMTVESREKRYEDGSRELFGRRLGEWRWLICHDTVGVKGVCRAFTWEHGKSMRQSGKCQGRPSRANLLTADDFSLARDGTHRGSMNSLT